jgi:hypothetical protein
MSMTLAGMMNLTVQALPELEFSGNYFLCLFVGALAGARV